MSEAASERVFYDRDGVRVTSARFQVGAQTYAMNAVSSVGYMKKPSPSGWRMASLVVGALFVLMGWFAMAETSMSGLPLGLLLFGVALCGGAIVLSVMAKPTFQVALRTSAGEVSALSSPSAAKIEPVVRALNEALVSRG